MTVATVSIGRLGGWTDSRRTTEDLVAVEEPLEIRVGGREPLNYRANTRKRL